MKKLLFIILFFSSNFFIAAQVPALHLQTTIGGSLSENMEGPNSISAKIRLKTNHGNTLVAGTTTSNNGDLSGNKGGRDIFVGELDTANRWIWKSTYGGSGDDYLMSLQSGIDSGYVVLGTTASNNNDVTGNHGNHDIWVLRLGSAGQIVWSKCYGGTAADEGAYLTSYSDSGYVFIGTTHSNDGDVSGIHINPSDTTNHIAGDIWIVRIDALGNKVWTKTYGGTYEDIGTIIKPSPFGGLICGGIMSSADGQGSGNHGSEDIWLAKLNTEGEIQWSKCYGGTNTEYLGDIEVNSDGYSFAGSTASNGGDTGPRLNPSLITYDCWLVRINPLGQIIAKKRLGGNGNESIEDFVRTADDKWLIAGYSSSTDGDIPVNKGGYDAFVAKVDDAGVVEWQKSFGGTANDFALNVFASSENEFLVLAETSSSTGDVIGNHGQDDLWLVSFGNANLIRGTIYIDVNSNGTKEASEPFADGVMVVATKPNYSQGTITKNGLFDINVGTGSYDTKVLLSLPYYNVMPPVINTTFVSYFQKDSFSFALQPIPNKQDLLVSVVPLAQVRPGFTASYRLIYKNIGTTPIPSGEVLFVKDRRANFISASPAVGSISGDTLKWSYANFNPGDSASILLNLQVAAPPTVKINDTLSFMAFINPVANDETPMNDTAMLKQRVVGSLDPNDKSEANTGSIPPSFVTNGNYLQYTIRFQNTGTDTAFAVVIRDTLSNRLDASTLEVVAASHPYNFSINKGVNLAWRFDNILLPDSNKNEPASHGYIVYRVRPKSDLAKGEIVHNTASIYFDYNLPVITNDATTQIQTTLVTLPQGLLHFYGSQQGSQVNLFWEVAKGAELNRFEIEKSEDGKTFYLIGNALATANMSSYRFTDKQATQTVVYYRLKLLQAGGGFLYSPVLMFQNKSGSTTAFSVYPNPLTTQGYAAIFSNKEGVAELQLFTPGGSLINREAVVLAKGQNVFAISRTPHMLPGQYLLRLVYDGQVKVQAFVVQ